MTLQSLRKDSLWIALPPGIGDCLWAITKVQAIAALYQDSSIVLGLPVDQPRRSLDYLQRYRFVSSVHYGNWSVMSSPRVSGTSFNYLPSGKNWNGYDWLLVPNSHLERGERLEHWLAEFQTDWRVTDKFVQHAQDIKTADSVLPGRPFAVLYFGPLGGNTQSGHNRNGLWKPSDWRDLADGLRGLGLSLVVVGASYDQNYVDKFLPLDGIPHINAIGKWTIGETLAVINRSMCFIGYQSGLGIHAAYCGTPTAMWWRPHGDSLIPEQMVTFSEDMAHCWTPPYAVATNLYRPLIYGRETPADIAQHVATWWFK